MTKLNPFILVVVDSQLNPDKYTLKQLSDNALAAWAAYAYDAAWTATATTTAAADAAYAAWTDTTDAVDYWLDSYFTITGEDKQDYINELEKPHD